MSGVTRDDGGDAELPERWIAPEEEPHAKGLLSDEHGLVERDVSAHDISRHGTRGFALGGSRHERERLPTIRVSAGGELVARGRQMRRLAAVEDVLRVPVAQGVVPVGGETKHG